MSDYTEYKNGDSMTGFVVTAVLIGLSVLVFFMIRASTVPNEFSKETGRQNYPRSATTHILAE